MAEMVVLARYSPRPKPPAGAAPDKHLRYEEDQKANSCDRQLDQARAWAASNGHTIVDTFREDAVSGDGGRVVLAQAVDRCRKGMILWVRDFDRISRKALYRLAVAEDLSDRGVRLFSLDEGFYNHEDDGSFAYFAIKAVMGELVRRGTKRKTSREMKRYQSEGRIMGGIPFGYEVDPFSAPNERGGKSRRRPCEAEQMALPALRAFRASELSQQAVAASLNAIGVPARGGKQWTASKVAKVFDNLSQETPRAALGGP